MALRGASVGVQARQRAALTVWDRVRPDRWDVAHTGAGAGAGAALATVDVAPRVRHDADVYVPHVGALVPAADADWLDALFEWVGMACLGAQRCVPCPAAFQCGADGTQAARQRPRGSVRCRVRAAARVGRCCDAPAMERPDGHAVCPVRDRRGCVRFPLLFLGAC